MWYGKSDPPRPEGWAANADDAQSNTARRMPQECALKNMGSSYNIKPSLSVNKIKEHVIIIK